MPKKRGELIKYEDVMKFERSEKFPEINPKEDVAMLQYTGGTARSPKGVMLTHYNLVVNAHQCKGMGSKGFCEQA